MRRVSQAVRRLASSTGARQVAGNLAWLLAEKTLRLVCGLAVGAWVARYLGPGPFGLLNYAWALAGLALFLPALGLDDVVRREVLRVPGADEAMRVLGTAWRLRAAAGLAAYGLYFAAVWAGSVEERPLLLVSGLMLLQPALWVPELYFQARDQARRGARMQLIALVVGSAARIALVASEARLIWFAVAGMGEVLLAAGLFWAMARTEGGAGWWRKWDRELAAGLMRSGLPLLLAGAAVSVYMKIDQVMLRAMAGEEEAGIYAAAVRLSEAVYFLPVATVMALLPAWSRAREAGGAGAERATQGMYDLLTALAFCFAAPVTCLSGWLVTLAFGAEFAPAAPVLAIHAWAAIFVFQGVVRSQEWVLEDLNRWTLWTTLAGAAANVGLNWLWIPGFGAAGAAAATLVSYGVAVWLLPFCFRPTRRSALRQTKALLLPATGWRYVRDLKKTHD